MAESSSKILPAWSTLQPRGSQPVRAAFACIEIALIQPQVFLAELARHQTDGKIQLAIARGSGERGALRIDPLAVASAGS